MKQLFIQEMTREGYSYIPLNMKIVVEKLDNWFGSHTWCDTGMAQQLTEEILNKIVED